MDSSYWEEAAYHHADFAVIGGGITGIAAALSLRERAPKARILVLERGITPMGASTRNAGFACFGSLTELLADLRCMGEAGMLQLVRERWAGLQILRRRLGDAALGFEPAGGYELIPPEQASALEELERVNALLREVFQTAVFRLQNERIREFGFAADRIQALVHNRFEGHLDAGRMMHALWQRARRQDIEIWSGADVRELLPQAGEVLLRLGGAPPHTLRAGRVAVCTNAFAKELLPQLTLSPGRGQVLVTEPLEQLRFRGTFHLEAGDYYFRDLGERVLLGGGRARAAQQEATTAFGPNPAVLDGLREKLASLILPGQRFAVARHWSGIMAFGPTKEPLVQPIGERIACGVRLGGMGVALGSRVGERVAALLTG